MKVQLGDRVKDKVTGFTGIAIARTEWMFGCVRITVQAEKLDKDGKEAVSITMDEPQLEVVKVQAVKGQLPEPEPTPQKRNYGPRDDKTALRRA